MFTSVVYSFAVSLFKFSTKGSVEEVSAKGDSGKSRLVGKNGRIERWSQGGRDVQFNNILQHHIHIVVETK